MSLNLKVYLIIIFTKFIFILNYSNFFYTIFVFVFHILFKFILLFIKMKNYLKNILNEYRLLNNTYYQIILIWVIGLVVGFYVWVIKAWVQFPDDPIFLKKINSYIII